MKSENEKLTEAARMLSRSCEERLDSCKGCLFCRSDLLCKLRGVPAEWNRDFGLDEHIVDVNKKVSTPTDTPTEADTPTDTPTTRAEILDAAKKIVTGDREKQYGKPEDNFAVIAEFWTTYIGHPISSEDIAIMMALLKIARIRSGNYKADSFIDGVGYLSLGGEISARNMEAR
jgi:hypothetical protein